MYWDEEGQWKEKDEWVDSRVEKVVFGLQSGKHESTRETNVYICGIETWLLVMWSTRSRTVGLVGRLSHKPLFLSMAPAGRILLWERTPLTGQQFFLFLLCFYFFNSWFWLYSIWCTLYLYRDALCTVHCTIFCVMSGLFCHWVNHTSSLTMPHFKHTQKYTHNFCTLSKLILQPQTVVNALLFLKHELIIWSITSGRSWCSFIALQNGRLK